MQRTNKQITSQQVMGTSEEHLHAIQDGVLIHQTMTADFSALVTAAKADGIELKVASGFRSFERQLMIWNNKYSGKTTIKSKTGDIVSPEDLTPIELIHSILLYSALPGASRHHWGCDIDVYAPNLLSKDYQLQLEPWEYSEEGPLAKLSTWLKQHAHQFGFYFPYAQFQGGVAHEPWHMSYAPLAKQYQQAFDIKLLSEVLAQTDILGKAVLLEHLDVIAKRYINNVCKIPDSLIT